MTKKKLDSYLVQAYQCPHSNKLFGLEQEDEFLKHVRAQERHIKEQQKTRNTLQERLDLWTTVRQKATCLNDIPSLLEALPDSLIAFYRKRAFYKEAKSTGWNLTFVHSPTLGLHSVTHRSPIGQPTNWGRDKPTMPKSQMALWVITKENLNFCFSESSRESGFMGCNNELVLYADDWPFVARMALAESLDSKSKYIMSSGPDLARYFSDMDRYSQMFLGMPYDDLVAMYKTLGLTSDVVLDMMARKQELRDTAETTLPDGLADEVPGP